MSTHVRSSIYAVACYNRVCSGSMVEGLTRDREAAGLSLTGVIVLCPCARHINPSFVLVQPRKTHSYITERLLMGRKETNKKKPAIIAHSDIASKAKDLIWDQNFYQHSYFVYTSKEDSG